MAHKSPARRHEQIELNEGLHGRLTAVSYTPKAGLSFAKWQEVGVTLGRLGRSMAWWTGDWLLWGENNHGEKYAQAIASTGRDEKTLLSYARVCKAVDQGRRRDELSFAHHEAVSTLDPDEQSFWLNRCIEGDKLPNGEREVWSSRRLRAELAKLGKPAEEPDPEIIVEAKELIPLDYLVPDIKQIREAWHAGKREIPGLKLVAPSPAQGEI